MALHYIIFRDKTKPRTCDEQPSALQWRHNEDDGVSTHRRVFAQLFVQAQIKNHQSSASLAFVIRIHRWPVNSPHKGPASNAEMFPFWWRHHEWAQNVLISRKSRITTNMSHFDRIRLICRVSFKMATYDTRGLSSYTATHIFEACKYQSPKLQRSGLVKGLITKRTDVLP